jgi:uncharacterized protein
VGWANRQASRRKRTSTVAALLLTMSAALPAWADDAADCANAWVLSKTDSARAVASCHRLADQGIATAQLGLGLMYFNGSGVPQDYAAAMMWDRKAAEQGNADAQYMGGFMYAFGKGVPQDDVAAMMWDRKAADQGNANAQYRLGSVYENGEGVPQDYVQAHMWFNLAAAQGDIDAAHARDDVAAKMTPDKIAQAQALAAVWKPTSGQ